MRLSVHSAKKQVDPIQVTLRCPHCGYNGTFRTLYEERTDAFVHSSTSGRFQTGQRFCPNPQCQGHIFFIHDTKTAINIYYPQERIDFEKDNIPEKVLSIFEEAVTCHANKCYVASAIMIRRTLEELCQDKKANGKTLYKRLQELRTKVILPEALFESLDELKLLGNDAAHVESRSFEEIGEMEIKLSIDLTKEILKSIYQLDDLVNRLKSLKKDANGDTK